MENVCWYHMSENIPSRHLSPWKPGLQPFKHEPLPWWHWSLLKQFPQSSVQFVPYVFCSHSVKVEICMRICNRTSNALSYVFAFLIFDWLLLKVNLQHVDFGEKLEWIFLDTFNLKISNTFMKMSFLQLKKKKISVRVSMRIAYLIDYCLKLICNRSISDKN